MEHSHEISFPELTFTAPGKYFYTIKELTPSCHVWETDSRTYRVEATVVEDAHGKLVASINYPDGMPTFVNKYHCPPSPPPCNPCECFDRLPFPMLWFFPPQKPEFVELIKKYPEVFDHNWWDEFFKAICGNTTRV